jgi:hypothetical protein
MKAKQSLSKKETHNTQSSLEQQQPETSWQSMLTLCLTSSST